MHYVTTEQPVIEAANHVATAISYHLSQGQRVLWLLSGGSGAAIAVAASQRLAGVDLTNLSITMTDERYGSLGHPDENWQQIMDAGFVAPGATLYRPLSGHAIADTAAAWGDWLMNALDNADFSIGVFGIGNDGHTAGIKPHTSATTSTQPIAAFTGDDFERLTITFPVIKRLDEVVIQASGSDKTAIIHELLSGHATLEDMPARILTTIPASTLYTTVKQENLS
jgi:6-phosphogluconolactonase/glucosamine-6-phosphate isomerase/deaminase